MIWIAKPCSRASSTARWMRLPPTTPLITTTKKHVEFDQAPFGITGLETAVSLSLDRLVHHRGMTIARLVELLAVNPARILNVIGGSLSEGAPADITILAPDLPVTVSVAAMRSKSKNTPFDGWQLRGGVAATIVAGRTVYVNEKVTESFEVWSLKCEVLAGEVPELTSGLSRLTTAVESRSARR